MTEGYVATRDAVFEVAAAALGAKQLPGAPWYTRDPSAPKARGLTGKALDDAIAVIAIRHPNRVLN